LPQHDAAAVLDAYFRATPTQQRRGAVMSVTAERVQQGTELSDRRRECLALTAQGMSSEEIARRLSLSPRTVEIHLSNAARRLGCVNRSHAVAVAIRSGVL